MIRNVAFIAMAIGLISAVPASAQTIQVPHRQKASWYTAPPELQIIDERPVVHDFREAPAAPQMMQLPPGPAAAAGGGGGPGGYRTPNPGYPLGLPRADFGHSMSNIPQGGIHSAAPLPNGNTTGIHGKTATPQLGRAPMLNKPGTRAAAPAAAPRSTPQYTASYGGGYGQSPISNSRGGGANTAVNGKLLNMLHKVK